jgi:hypothetical protein
MKLKLIWGSFLLVLLFSACQKEISGDGGVVPVNPSWVSTAPAPNAHPVRQLLDGFKPAPINSTFLNTNGILLTLGDVVIIVPTNCFVKQDNSMVTGNVNLKVIKATKFEDMVYHSLGTLTNNGLLSTAGMVNLEATQGTDLLKIASGKKVDVYFQNTIPAAYQGFSGKINNTVTNNITWNLNTQWGVDSSSLGIPGAIYTRIKIDSCQWVNCDYFYNQPNPTNIYLKLPAAFGNSNTLCYIVFRTDKVMAGLYADAANQRYWQGANYKVPIGKNVRLFAVGKKDNKNYYGAVDLTITADQIVTIPTMEEVTDAQLQTKLNAL